MVGQVHCLRSILYIAFELSAFVHSEKGITRTGIQYEIKNALDAFEDKLDVQSFTITSVRPCVRQRK